MTLETSKMEYQFTAIIFFHIRLIERTYVRFLPVNWLWGTRRGRLSLLLWVPRRDRLPELQEPLQRRIRTFLKPRAQDIPLLLNPKGIKHGQVVSLIKWLQPVPVAGPKRGERNVTRWWGFHGLGRLWGLLVVPDIVRNE